MHTLTTAQDAWLVVEPTHRDAQVLAAEARTAGGRLAGHPDTVRALHAAVVVYGPMIRRTTLAAVLGVDVDVDPGLPTGLVLLVGVAG